MRELLDKYKGFIFDMDGTLYLEDKMIDGATEVLNYLIEQNKDLIFVTNKTTNTKEEYAEFLNRNGIEVSETQILTALDNCFAFLQSEKKGKTFYAIAENTFIKSIVDVGLSYTEVPLKVDIVILSLDRNYSKQKFEIAKEAILNGAEFIAANIDNTCPVIGGEITDAGAIIAELEAVTNKKLEKHFGKPSENMISAIRKRLKFEKRDYLLLGDRVETDIKMGNKMGIDTLLVNSGVANKLSNMSDTATYIVNSLKNIL